MDITEFFGKLKFICHWADPIKDLKWPNVPRIKLSSLSKSDDTFPSLQALSNLYYLFGGFMDYLWSRKLNISNFGPADRKILPVVPSGRTSNALSIPRRFLASMFSSLIASLKASATTFPFQGDNKSHNRNLQAILANDVVSCSMISMDILKITRKQSKMGKHGHENQKSTKRSQRNKAEARKVKPQSNQSNPVKCMRTRSQARNQNRRQQQLTTVIVEEPEFPMADNRTMAQMLQAPIEGYEDAIVVPPINANNFELKQPLINLVQSNKFTDGEARDWLDKEPPRSILTWDDLVSKFINQFFPPSKTTYLRNKITTFYQEPF
ncbi:reverse transcriptase domain-containing protein [Tanacetum coccineum]